MTKILIGTDFWKQRSENKTVPVYWSEAAVSNHHIGVAGTSGAGKTHWIKQFVSSMPPSVEVDIFDYHGDIDVAGATPLMFSESTRYGFNPLVVNPDPHYGGPRRAINDVIGAINGSSRQLGGNQEGVLRNLLTDAYAMKGIYPDNPRSWKKREATEAEHRQMSLNRDWNGLREVYPTLKDVIALANRKLRALWMGIEDKDEGRTALTAFDEYCRNMQSLNQRRTKLGKASNDEDVIRLEAQVETAKAKALDTYTAFLSKVNSGREFEEMIKYTSKDVLLSVITRLENLRATGIFDSNPPPFGEARVRRYILKPLAQSEDELRMFIRFRLRAIIREEMQRGESGGKLRRLIVLDEAKKFNDELVDNPLNVIVNEMRKFGLALLMAGQSPAHWSRDFITNAGTLLLLNLATSDWDAASRSLKIDVKNLKYLRPRETGAVRILENGQAATFRQIAFG